MVIWYLNVGPSEHLVLSHSSALLNEVHLGSGNAGCCDEGAVLGTDERQVALGLISAVLSSLELSLETTHTGHCLR